MKNVQKTLSILLNWNPALSKNFRLNEFFDSETAIVNGIVNCPPTYTKLEIVLKNLTVLAEILQLVREIRRKPIYVTSGYRCNELNDAVFGKLGSQHRYGRAVDVTAHDFDELVKDFEFLDLSKKINFIVYPERRYIHIQLRPNIGYHFPEKKPLSKNSNNN